MGGTRELGLEYGDPLHMGLPLDSSSLVLVPLNWEFNHCPFHARYLPFQSWEHPKVPSWDMCHRLQEPHPSSIH